MQAPLSSRGESTVSGRFERVLRGRVASRWAQWVGISQGTLSRIRKDGSLPDPEKLSAACRAENLSLTWLLDGIGTPYLTYPATGTADASQALRMLLEDEPWSVLVVQSAAGAAIALHQPASVNIANGTCDYEAVAVIGGGYDAFAVLGTTSDSPASRRVRRLDVGIDDWRRLASGHMASTELFGWRDEPGGLVARAALHVAEPQREFAEYAYAGAFSDPPPEWREEALRILGALEAHEVDVAMRMIRGLRR